MSIRTFASKLTLIAIAFSTLLLTGRALGDETIKGQVLGGGEPIVKSTVTLWEASTGAPKQLAQTKTDGDGRFEVRSNGAIALQPDGLGFRPGILRQLLLVAGLVMFQGH